MKKETLEKAAYQARRDYQNEVGKDGMNECIMFDAMKIQKGFELGGKWQAERMYSEKEVKQIIEATLIEYSDFVLADIPEWFEKFKKKQNEK